MTYLHRIAEQLNAMAQEMEQAAGGVSSVVQTTSADGVTASNRHR